MIAETLRSNERVDLRGFGRFTVKDRKERQGRNPRTGESITITAKRDASFKPGEELTEKPAQGERAPKTEEAARSGRATNAEQWIGVMVNVGGAVWLR
jgi:hypothetical protein